jgi:hypothetical protein
MNLPDPKRCVDWLLSQVGEPPKIEAPAGAPVREYMRSPAASAVAGLAARDGLFAFHFEHRHHLELPEEWSDDDSVAWRGGVLPERKYHSFQHELAVASFHPAHRAKWGTHELCHGLVGFAWRSDATPLFHATAARLAELLPVALWYFFDEAFLQRCPDHQGGGALFRTMCGRCERMASAVNVDPQALPRIRDGIAFVERELGAIRSSRSQGRPVPHVHGTLDLCSDGLAYAQAHGARLGSDAFHRWMDRFAVHGGGWSADLDELETRVEEVLGGLLLGEPVRAMTPSPEAGRDRWVRQDLGARLLLVHSETDGECAEALLALVDRLADGATIHEVVDGYRELEEAFAVGYPLVQGLGSDLEQLEAGVRSALPATAAWAGADLTGWVSAFATQDENSRCGIGERFAQWLTAHGPEMGSDVARFEAAMAHPPASDVARNRVLGLGTGPYMLAEGARLLRFAWEPAELRDALLSEQAPPARQPHDLVMGRAGDEWVMAEIDSVTADALEEGSALSSDVGQGLSELGLCSPAAWELTTHSR